MPRDKSNNFSSFRRRYKVTLSAVHMVYRLVNSTYNTKELLLRLTRLICQLIDADSADVYLLDAFRKKKQITLIASFNNRINMLIEKRSDIERVPQDEKDVTTGSSIYKKHLIGLPLVADDTIGAIFIRRKKTAPAFTDFDQEILAVIAEQAVTAIKNLQLYENQQKIILGSIKSIGRLLEMQSNAASIHSPVYFQVVKSLAEKLNMRQAEIECLRYASILHDIGSVNVPFEILSKTSRLTAEEFKIIRDHPANSVELIKPVEFLKPVLPIILYHHEQYDGTGYPSGLKKEHIPLGARVMAVVDAFEAIVSARPYKKALSISEALLELQRNSGTQFDPKVISAFSELVRQKKFRKYLSLMK